MNNFSNASISDLEAELAKRRAAMGDKPIAIKPALRRTEEHYQVKPGWANSVGSQEENWPKTLWVILTRDGDDNIVNIQVSG